MKPLFVLTVVLFPSIILNELGCEGMDQLALNLGTTNKELQAQLDNGPVLGKGAFGTVIKIKFGDKEFAAKRIRFQKSKIFRPKKDAPARKSLEQEIEFQRILSQLQKFKIAEGKMSSVAPEFWGCYVFYAKDQTVYNQGGDPFSAQNKKNIVSSEGQKSTTISFQASSIKGSAGFGDTQVGLASLPIEKKTSSQTFVGGKTEIQPGSDTAADPNNPCNEKSIDSKDFHTNCNAYVIIVTEVLYKDFEDPGVLGTMRALPFFLRVRNYYMIAMKLRNMNSEQTAIKLPYKILADKKSEQDYYPGVIHADFKPANMMASKPDIDEIKLVDFGLAGFRAQPIKGGSPVYNTPEKINPKQAIDGINSSMDDIWALTVTILEIEVGLDSILSGMSPKCFMENYDPDCGLRFRENISILKEYDKKTKTGDIDPILKLFCLERVQFDNDQRRGGWTNFVAALTNIPKTHTDKTDESKPQQQFDLMAKQELEALDKDIKQEYLEEVKLIEDHLSTTLTISGKQSQNLGGINNLIEHERLPGPDEIKFSTSKAGTILEDSLTRKELDILHDPNLTGDDILEFEAEVKTLPSSGSELKITDDTNEVVQIGAYLSQQSTNQVEAFERVDKEVNTLISGINEEQVYNSVHPEVHAVQIDNSNAINLGPFGLVMDLGEMTVYENTETVDVKINEEVKAKTENERILELEVAESETKTKQKDENEIHPISEAQIVQDMKSSQLPKSSVSLLLTSEYKQLPALINEQTAISKSQAKLSGTIQGSVQFVRRQVLMQLNV